MNVHPKTEFQKLMNRANICCREKEKVYLCVVNYYRNFPSGSDGCFVDYPCVHTLYVRHTEPSTIPSSFQRDSSTQSEMSISGSLKTFTDKIDLSRSFLQPAHFKRSRKHFKRGVFVRGIKTISHPNSNEPRFSSRFCAPFVLTDKRTLICGW